MITWPSGAPGERSLYCSGSGLQPCRSLWGSRACRRPAEGGWPSWWDDALKLVTGSEWIPRADQHSSITEYDMKKDGSNDLGHKNVQCYSVAVKWKWPPGGRGYVGTDGGPSAGVETSTVIGRAAGVVAKIVVPFPEKLNQIINHVPIKYDVILGVYGILKLLKHFCTWNCIKYRPKYYLIFF